MPANVFAANPILDGNISIESGEGDDSGGSNDDGNDGDGDGSDSDGIDGDGSEGDEIDGDGVDGNGVDGDGSDGDGINGDGINGDGSDGGGSDGDGIDGDGIDGDGVDGDGIDGDGVDGNGVDGDGSEGDGIDGDGDGSNGDTDDMYTDDDIEKVILRILESKVKHGWSEEETLSQIRNIYELTHDDRIPHKCWGAVLKFLKELGYKDPQHYKVCCGSNHVTLLGNKEGCPNCGNSWNKCVDYFVLGLQLENYFLNESTVEDHLRHWKNKGEWLNKHNNQDVNLKEVWHGKRFRELSYFWDASVETFIPVCCPNCENVISVEEMNNSVLPGNTLHDPVHLSCQECTFDFIHTPKTMTGCALNQAFVFHEDGFNAFVQKSRGIAAIHISSACISKEQRTGGKYMRVYSFIPSSSLGEGISHKVDAFFKPLINEIKDMYINGIPIHIHQQINLSDDNIIYPGNYQVRALLLLGTADLKAHQEITLYAGGGRIGCRRCTVNGIYIPAKRHYYYGNFGARFRHPSAIKSAEYHLHHGKRVDNAMTIGERQRLQTETGVTGVSILFDLYLLYGFDPVQDMAIDRMHVTFNMLKREFVDKIWADMGNNANKHVNSREPDDGGLINREDFAAALYSVCWPKEERASGVPKLKSFTDKLGSWKSNEFKKFSAVAAVVLSEKIPTEAYNSYVLLCDAVQMLYSKALRNDGWSISNIERLNSLLWAHAIRAEEFYGLGYCTENLEDSVHAAAEIRRHSSMDNYSCELYERAIRIHKRQKNNSKGLEKTFTIRESIRDFLECYKRKNGPISTYHERDSKFQFQMEVIDNGTPFFLHESSYQFAVNIIDTLKDNESPSVKHALKFGVVIGKMKRKVYPNAIIADIQRYFQRELGLHGHAVPNILHSLKLVAILDQFEEVTNISKSDICKIASGNNAEEWIMKIDDIIQVGPLQGNYYTFINGKYFIPAYQNGQVVCHDWTGTPHYVERGYTRDSVQTITCIRRKVIMFPEPSNLENPNYFLCNDLKNPELFKVVQVPIYPDVGDTVKVRGTNNEDWYGKVNNVNLDERKATIQWYRETRRRGVWVILPGEPDEVHFRSLLGLAVATRTLGGFTITDIEQ